ncbi:CapA family protein [Thermanaerothrix sp.]|uniref:CapA family protein n=1 Tax=Thermanaerothrix sp. TaxID=2972675 RepID=UPI003C7B182C
MSCQSGRVPLSAQVTDPPLALSASLTVTPTTFGKTIEMLDSHATQEPKDEAIALSAKGLPALLVRALRQAGYLVEEGGVGTVVEPTPWDSKAQDDDQILARWLLLLVAPFPTTVDGVAWSDFYAAWRGERPWMDPTTVWGGQPLLMSPSTLEILRKVWGTPATEFVRVEPEERIQEAAWAQHAWAIIPFEDLNPRWKVLKIDGWTGLESDAKAFPLWISFGVKTPVNTSQVVVTNYRPEHLVSVILSGTTALVRYTALRMEEKGTDYPGLVLAPLLRSADILHISNEVSFDPNCPPAKPLRREARFCSDPRYLSLLEFIGADVIELTGNHLLDWGEEPFLYTLNLYQRANLPYYGGGANREEAQGVLKMTVKGTRLAFLGCNAVGPEAVWAPQDKAGAAPCDMEGLIKRVKTLRSEGYLPIVTFQHLEVDDFKPASQARYDFQAVAQAGAVVVSGSQAHFPQGFSFENEAFIHYGLGNLFFDQMFYWNRRAFLDRHLFYEGRYLGVDLVTIILEDYAQPRLMTSTEREELLQAAFSASDW